MKGRCRQPEMLYGDGAGRFAAAYLYGRAACLCVFSAPNSADVVVMQPTVAEGLEWLETAGPLWCLHGIPPVIPPPPMHRARLVVLAPPEHDGPPPAPLFIGAGAEAEGWPDWGDCDPPGGAA